MSNLDRHTLDAVYIHASNQATEAGRMAGDALTTIVAARWEGRQDAYERLAAWAKRESAEAKSETTGATS
jgi:hypothetical protein